MTLRTKEGMRVIFKQNNQSEGKKNRRWHFTKLKLNLVFYKWSQMQSPHVSDQCASQTGQTISMAKGVQVEWARE